MDKLCSENEEECTCVGLKIGNHNKQKECKQS